MSGLGGILDLRYFRMFDKRVFVRVYRLPSASQLTDGFCFSGGRPIVFQNVDWFEADPAHGRRSLEAFIRAKPYFDPRARFLILGDHPDLVFCIDPV